MYNVHGMSDSQPFTHHTRYSHKNLSMFNLASVLLTASICLLVHPTPKWIALFSYSLSLFTLGISIELLVFYSFGVSFLFTASTELL